MLLEDLIQAGIPTSRAEEQIRLFQAGTRYAALVRSASAGDGILQLGEKRQEHLQALYTNRALDIRIMKFVPASGAATRMFKDLIAYNNTGEASPHVESFFERIEDYPFANNIGAKHDKQSILDQLLSDEALAYAGMPKGLIPFHRYEDEVRTAFEEHLVEGAEYARTADKVSIHFTISSAHLSLIKEKMNAWQAEYAKRLDCEYDLGFSVQHPTTDTMCMRLDGEAHRDDQGRLIMRPGGHGSLIHNLHELDTDIIFIKNIDNVVQDGHRGDTLRWKEILAGLLIELRNEARVIIQGLKSKTVEADHALEFLAKVGYMPDGAPNDDELIALMNRPYRVCGMVANQGEPGGGPFWVKKNKATSLQIVESAEIDPQDSAQMGMLKQGTHFNPVDLVCCLNDLYGRRQDLNQFVDQDSAFVTSKNMGGTDVKVLEWPGLWNGAMAHWNTVFVEVPISTFNPVKRVNDLLRPLHLPLDA